MRLLLDTGDADVLVASQARAEDAVVVTTNPRHFELFVEATEWSKVCLAGDDE